MKFVIENKQFESEVDFKKDLRSSEVGIENHRSILQLYSIVGGQKGIGISGLVV